MTFLPAVLVLAGRRGWIKPRRDLTARFWRRSGIRIVRRPKSHLVASLVDPVAWPAARRWCSYNYDDRKSAPPEHRELPRLRRVGPALSR